MICVKLLPQRELGPRLSISAHHLRMVLISQTRRRSFCRRVRLLQNDLSTPSSPVALLSMPHTSLFTVAMATVWQGWVVSKALWSLAKTPLHTYLCYVALIPPFWSSFDGDIKPGGILDVPYKTLCLTGWDADSPRTDAPVRLGCSLPANRYHLIICSPTDREPLAVGSAGFLLLRSLMPKQKQWTAKFELDGHFKKQHSLCQIMTLNYFLRLWKKKSLISRFIYGNASSSVRAVQWCF